MIGSRALALLSAVGTLAFLAAALTLHGLQPELDPVSVTVSEHVLGSGGWPFTVGCAAWGLGSLALAALLAGTGRSRTSTAPPAGAGRRRAGARLPAGGGQSRAGIALLVAWAVGILLVAIFPTDPIDRASHVKTPLTREIREAVERTWGVTGDGERLHGGEESAAYRLDGHVIRIGPAGRAAAELEWCHAIARHAAAGLPEAVAPLPTSEGTTVIVVAGRPISCRPYVEGEWPDADVPAQRDAGARLLARLHRALADVRPGPRPVPAFQESGLYGDPPRDAAELRDPDLDRWLAGFRARHPTRHPLHGDYYTGNTLARDGRLVAVLDWDEAFVGAPELELGAAALEWGDDVAGPSREFVAAYHEAGGTARPLDEEAPAQLVRHKLRREYAYFHKAVQAGVRHDEEDLEYHRIRVELFHRLSP
ncbi:phosphotransferase enzyme family protein [Nonomuraea fastidiosa]